MGAGAHGGFGHTKGSRSTPRFTRVQYEGTVKVNGEIRDVSRRVYQRNDIDFEYVHPISGCWGQKVMPKHYHNVSRRSKRLTR